jgi:EAL domain-containing protein (putative c-di-GMP-specific phosphodiesterase class I)
VERGRVEHVLRAALERAAGPAGPVDGPVLSLVYQPIVDLDTERLVGVEALARLRDADGLPIGPDVFIPIAEETGLIAPLGRLVLETACADLAAWHGRHPAHRALTMAVNLSARQLGLVDLTGDVQAALRRTGVPAACLTLELTESVLLEAGPSATTALHTLHGWGVGISIDDFGTGYASLRYLTQLPVTAVKVDRSFTSGLPDDPAAATIVRAVSTLARELGLSCVVEGIETDAQLRTLPPGVLGQGYLLGRPQTADDLEQTLRSRRLPASSRRAARRR